MDDDAVEAYLDELRATIDEHGHAVQQVASGGDEPGWSYTIGLDAFELPELIIVGGVPRGEQGSILNGLAARMRDGEELELGARDPSVLEGFDVTYVEVADTTTEDFAVALRLQRSFRAVQIVWPDVQNRFQWDPGYAFPPREQRLLGSPGT